MKIHTPFHVYVLALYLLASIGLNACGSNQQHSSEQAGEQLTEQPTPQLLAGPGAKDYLKRGKTAAQATGKALMGKLQEAIADQGPAGAISFCQIHALPITHQMAKEQGVDIQRTALRLRNPANAPDSLERATLSRWTDLADGQQQLEPLAYGAGRDSVRVFLPIRLKPLCTTCHGPQENLSPEIKQALAEAYPQDKAVGFQPGDLRGMWSISMARVE